MEENYNKPEKTDSTDHGETSKVHDYLAPGVPIVRTSTPRPLPFLMPAKTELPLAPSGAAAKFPTQAPDAPPLPEEPANADEASVEQIPFSTPQVDTEGADAGQESRQVASEFIWLFEYALDMDPVHLNHPERLNGSAFAYGPAQLKGYKLAFEGLDTFTGHVLASLHEMRDSPDAEVWGILYRVPQRFTMGENGEAALLDKVHCADTFIPLEVQVREPYRQREITCIVYIATEAARQQVGQLAPENRRPEAAYCKRLLQIARRQKLPASYVRALENSVSPGIPAATAPATVPPEQNTEPLPAMLMGRTFRRQSSEHAQANAPITPDGQSEDGRQTDQQPVASRLSVWKAKQQAGESHSTSAWKAKQRLVEQSEQRLTPRKVDQRSAERVEPYPSTLKADPQSATQRESRATFWKVDQHVSERAAPWSVPYPAGIERWLMAFGLYISLVLLAVLVLAIFQGLNFWPDVFNNAFTPLGIPWYVLLYGLLGGCVSCVISLNRPVPSYPPTFVVLTWFVRPLIGATLGAFAYLLLNSGAILLSAQPTQHFALCSVVSGLAGLCEGKLLLRKSFTQV